MTYLKLMGRSTQTLITTFFLVFAAVLLPQTIFAQAFEQDLFFGLQGNNDVLKLQEFLKDESIYSGPITGNFFSLTLRAVKDFQIRESVSPISGYFGPLTRGKANTILADRGIGSGVTNENGSLVSFVIVPPKTTDDIVVKLNDQIKVLMDQLNELKKNQDALALQNQTLAQIQTQQQAQSQTLIQIQQNTTPPPAPVIPPADTTPPVFMSGPTAVVILEQDGLYRIQKINYMTDEPVSVVWWPGTTDQSLSRLCADQNGNSKVGTLKARTTYNCTYKIVDKAGNMAEAPFSFTTGAGSLTAANVGLPGGFANGEVVVFRMRLANLDIAPVLIESIKLKLMKGFGGGDSNFSVSSIEPFIYTDSSFSVSETTLSSVAISNFDGEKLLTLDLPVSISAGDSRFVEFRAKFSSVSAGAFFSTRLTELNISSGGITPRVLGDVSGTVSR